MLLAMAHMPDSARRHCLHCLSSAGHAQCCGLVVYMTLFVVQLLAKEVKSLRRQLEQERQAAVEVKQQAVPSQQHPAAAATAGADDSSGAGADEEQQAAASPQQATTTDATVDPDASAAEQAAAQPVAQQGSMQLAGSTHLLDMDVELDCTHQTEDVAHEPLVEGKSAAASAQMAADGSRATSGDTAQGLHVDQGAPGSGQPTQPMSGAQQSARRQLELPHEADMQPEVVVPQEPEQAPQDPAGPHSTARLGASAGAATAAAAAAAAREQVLQAQQEAQRRLISEVTALRQRLSECSLEQLSGGAQPASADDALQMLDTCDARIQAILAQAQLLEEPTRIHGKQSASAEGQSHTQHIAADAANMTNPWDTAAMQRPEGSGVANPAPDTDAELRMLFVSLLTELGECTKYLCYLGVWMAGWTSGWLQRAGQQDVRVY